MHFLEATLTYFAICPPTLSLSNGQRSAMNLADREHYLRSAAVPGETISRFFQANYWFDLGGRKCRNVYDFLTSKIGNEPHFRDSPPP